MIKEQVMYQGKLEKYQQFGTKPKYQLYERDEFNSYQNFLYKRVLFGLSVYEKDELTVMHWDKKNRINKVHKHAQKVMNIWKQQIINNITNSFLTTYFGNSSFVKDLITNHGNTTDDKFVNIIEFKNLGISKKDIINKLIIEKILPHNFYKLKPLKKDGNLSRKHLDYRLFKFKQRTVSVSLSTESNIL